jgi:CubicO group peptidase (beta-lactamase class C family)
LPYSKGTYYWSGSQGTLFWIDPKEELVGVLMVQLTPNRLQLREKFSALVYSSLVE